MPRPIRSFLLPSLVLISKASAWLPGPDLARYRSPPTRLMAVEEESEEVQTRSTHSVCNVLGTELSCCCCNVGGSGIGTGFYRNGFCAIDDMDMGRHTVCVSVTDEFLAYSKSVGNDLSTPVPQYSFPGLNNGDIWCLNAQRWAQACFAGKAPRVILQSTHEETLRYVPLEVLKAFAITREEADAVIDKLNLQRQYLDALVNTEATCDNDSFQ